MNTYYIAGFPISDELYHYGIKGQRWGIRRFQNEDGSYTSAGKKRYGAIGSLFGFGKSEKPKYTDQEFVDLYNKDPDSVDYTRVNHYEKGDVSEGVKYVANLLLSGTNIVGAAGRISRGAEFVGGLFNSKKYESERSDNPIDPSTGFRLKDREYSKEEDLKRVNPDFKDFNTNSKNNCMLCTATMEMRCRGFDVTANKAGYGYFKQDLERWFPGVQVTQYNPSQTVLSTGTVDSLYSDLNSQMLSDNPEGARGNFMVDFIFGGGHSMFYEIENGQLVIRDGQTGETYKTEYIKTILSYCTNIEWARLDNVPFDPEAIKECCR